jgi:peptidoglycan/xylan/chitin deacetylase (PgdA/CDA1 family)
VRAQASLVREELAQGNIVGNHTWSHADVAGGGPAAISQLRSTSDVIQAVTGFRPCLFRPPYGATSSTLAGDAWSLGLNTIVWDVDPTDWARPGSGVIYSRIMAQVHPGSIILDHDGGGPRDQTVAALPHVIAALRARGYGFVTLPELLGLKLIYK